MRPALVLLLLLSCTYTCPQGNIQNFLFDLRFDRITEVKDLPAGRTGDLLSELYLHNYIYFLKALTAGDDRTYQEYRLHAAEYAGSITDMAVKGPEYLHCLAIINIQSAILAIDHDEGWKALRNYYTAWRMIHTNQEQYPAWFPDLLPLGILEIIAGTLPQEYIWLMKRAGISGSITSGQAKLARYHAGCSREDQLEATLILGLSFYQFDPREGRAYRFLQTFSKEYSGILLYDYLLSLSAMKAGQNDTAINIMKKMTGGEGGYRFPYTFLLLGEAKLNRLDRDAQTYLLDFLEKYEGKNYIRMACHKLSWYYFLNDDPLRYRQMRDRVLATGRDLTEADRQAFLEAADTSRLNPILLKARLLYDGGYYDEGIDLLTGSDQPPLLSQRDSLEYHYRLGRLYQKKGDHAGAAARYNQVISQGTGQPYYFVVNALLQMGMLAEEKGRYAEAEQFYQSCLEAEKTQYRKSIDQKARAGLDRINGLKSEKGVPGSKF